MNKQQLIHFIKDIYLTSVRTDEDCRRRETAHLKMTSETERFLVYFQYKISSFRIKAIINNYSKSARCIWDDSNETRSAELVINILICNKRECNNCFNKFNELSKTFEAWELYPNFQSVLFQFYNMLFRTKFTTISALKKICQMKKIQQPWTKILKSVKSSS